MGVTAITNTVVNKRFPNGTEWTLAQEGVAPNPYGIKTINGSWYALGRNGIWKSDDAFTWVQWAFAEQLVTSLIYVDDKFLAKIGNTIYYSQDNGGTWVEVAIPTSDNFFKIIYAKGVYSTGSAWSTDLINWTKTNLISNTIRNFTSYSNGVWFANGTKSTSSSEKMWISFDGKNYTLPASYDGEFVSSIEYANGVWIAISARQIFRSIDAQNWELVYTGNSSFVMLAYGNGLWIAGVQSVPSRAVYSTDNGKTWMTGITNLRGRYFPELKYRNGIWIGGNNNSTQNVYWSIDGIHFNVINLHTTLDLLYFSTIDYSQGIWTAICNNGDIYTSIGWQPT